LAVVLGCGPPSQLPTDHSPAVISGPAEPSAERLETPPHRPFPAGRIVDLTHAFGKDTIFWPTDTAGFQLERGPFGVTERGYFYSANRFSMAEHGGTHLDAPIHFF